MLQVKKQSSKKTPYNKTNLKKKVNSFLCTIGYCFDEEKLNDCQVSRPAGTQIITEVFGSVTENNRTFFVDPLYIRILLIRLYQTQKNFASFEYIILHNILIYINFVILQNEDHTRTIEISTTGNKNSRITLLISSLKIKSFILQLCDKDFAHKKSSDILISDLLVDKNLRKIKFDTRKVKVELESEITVECNACDFTKHELIMCLDLKKMLVCLKNKPSEEHNLNILNVGILGFMTDGYIEMSWSPHLR
ncbi:8027_t:CDS:2, partial [Cetraspora pellucida]